MDYQYDVNLDRNTRKKINFGKVCQKFTKGKDCDECAKSDALYKASRSAQNQVEKEKYLADARTVYAKSKIFINAINIKDEDKTFPVRTYALPPSVYDDLMGQIRGLRQLDYESNVFHPITGRNILVTKKGSSIQTRYTVQIDNKPTEIPNAMVLEKLKNGDLSCLPNLDDIEEFVHQNYLHITQFENNGNIIRLMPPYNGNSIYKELKFHRFTIDVFNKKFDDREANNEDNDVPNEAIITSTGKQDKFDPLAIIPTPSIGNTTFDFGDASPNTPSIGNTTFDFGDASPESPIGGTDATFEVDLDLNELQKQMQSIDS